MGNLRFRLSETAWVLNGDRSSPQLCLHRRIFSPDDPEDKRVAATPATGNELCNHYIKSIRAENKKAPKKPDKARIQQTNARLYIYVELKKKVL